MSAGGQTRGAVAAGSPATVEAGLRALRLGGNAVDAAIAATLMACVAEPLLTGLAGAGLATVRMGGQVRVCDFFTAMPGLGHKGPQPPVDEIAVDFGVTTQIFHCGPGTIAVPGLPGGLAALHDVHGSIDLAELAVPAVAASREGVPVSAVFAKVAGLLWPILVRDPEIAAHIGPNGRPPVEGERFSWPEMGESLAAFAREGAAFFRDGSATSRLLDGLGDHTRLTHADLSRYQATWTEPLSFRYRDATVWLPGPPSVAGLLVLTALRALEDGGPMPEAFGSDEVVRLVSAQRAAESFRAEGLNQRLFSPEFLDGALARLGAGRSGGFTTHISTVDGEGNAVAITHSLGETCGLALPGMGVLLNNFLGEADVNPTDGGRAPGQRLFTMCCPTLMARGDQICALGTGGSNRIRSAILTGLVNLIDHGLDPAAAVAGPRAHVERGVVHLEAEGRAAETLDEVLRLWPDRVAFPERHLFFGGLHVVQAAAGPTTADRFDGAGDARRSGTWGRI